MKSPKMFIITEGGQKTVAPIFQPFFQTVWPALMNEADEIHINAEGMIVSAAFLRGARTVPLRVHNDYYPAIISSRIRIASGMSIVPGELQSGNIRLGYEGRSANVGVEIKRTATQETISMKLTWDQPE